MSRVAITRYIIPFQRYLSTPKTIDQVSKRFNISYSTSARVLRELTKLGYLTVDLDLKENQKLYRTKIATVGEQFEPERVKLPMVHVAYNNTYQTLVDLASVPRDFVSGTETAVHDFPNILCQLLVAIYERNQQAVGIVYDRLRDTQLRISSYANIIKQILDNQSFRNPDDWFIMYDELALSIDSLRQYITDWQISELVETTKRGNESYDNGTIE